VHWLPSSQLRGVPQSPAWQVVPVLHGSLHVAPSRFLVHPFFVQVPVSQAPVQVVVPPLQVPSAWQVSPLVQARPSSHAWPTWSAAPVWQTPALQVSAWWQ
jgi:hypothetical protein